MAVDACDLAIKTALLLHFVAFLAESQGDYAVPMFSGYTIGVLVVALSAVVRILDLQEVAFVVQNGYSRKWKTQSVKAASGGVDPRVQRDADVRMLKRLKYRTIQAVFVDCTWICLMIVRNLIFKSSTNDVLGIVLGALSQCSAGFVLGKKYATIAEYMTRTFVKKEKPKAIYEVLPANISCGSAASEEEDTVAAVEDAWRSLEAQVGSSVSYIFVALTCNHDVEVGLARLHELAPGVCFSGATTCQGVLHNGESMRKNMRVVGLFGIADPEGAYAVHAVELGEDPYKVAQEAARVCAVKRRSMRANDANPVLDMPPSFVLVNPCPGSEDRLLAGVASVLGSVPLFGGSSGDNTVAGEWKQWACDGVHPPQVTKEGCSFAFCYTSAVVQGGLFTGYNASAHSGIVTKCDGLRHILEVDHRPATVVYNEWTGGALAKEMEEDDANVLGVSSLFPVGQKSGEHGGEPYYRVMHPHLLKKETQSFTLFSDVKEGEPLTMMSGTVDNLVNRIAQVSSNVIQSSSFSVQEVRGAMIIFCAGCMMYTSDKIHIAAQKLDDALGGVPHLGVHTFGEQGPFPDGQSRHGNLMFAAMVFSSKRRIMKVVNVDTGESTLESDKDKFMKLVEDGDLDDIFATPTAV